jgi:hypothetical protein
MHRRRRTFALVIALAVSLAAPAAALAAPRSHAVPDGSPGGAAARGFRMDVAESGDYVQQANFVQCVGASMQMMLNMQRPGADRTARTQVDLQDLARDWSGPRPDGVTRQGASVRGWAAGLTIRGGGPYRLVGTQTLEEALRVAASAIRDTGRPVGLLVWRGRHAWVMSGFEATADPALTDEFTVLRANILDPLWPHGSSTWGPSPRPGAALTPEVIGRQFVKRSSSSRWLSTNPTSKLRGTFVLVLPFDPQPTAAGRIRLH